MLYNQENMLKASIFIISKKFNQQIYEKAIGYCPQNRTWCSRNCFQKVVHKAAEATGGFKVNKIANKIKKPKPVPDENWRNIEEIVIPPDKRQVILNALRQVLLNGTP